MMAHCWKYSSKYNRSQPRKHYYWIYIIWFSYVKAFFKKCAMHAIPKPHVLCWLCSLCTHLFWWVPYNLNHLQHPQYSGLTLLAQLLCWPSLVSAYRTSPNPRPSLPVTACVLTSLAWWVLQITSHLHMLLCIAFIVKLSHQPRQTQP